jgi:hypothetical protein
MTQAETVYGETLNLLGSDLTPLPPEIRQAVDAEHVAASPTFAETVKQRLALAG